MTIANQIISFKLSGINYVGTSTQLNYTSGVIAGISYASKSLVLDVNKNITGINILTSENLVATAGITGTLSTPLQTNITKVGTLNGLVVSSVLNLNDHDGLTGGLQLAGSLVTATAAELNYLSGSTVGNAVGSKALVVNSNRSISNINSISCSALSISTTLSINNVSVLSSASELNYVNTQPGTAAATKALITDSSRNISNINSLSATSITSSTLTGTLVTPLQTNITQVGTLSSLTLSGSVSGVSNISMTGNLTGANNLSATTIAGTLTTPLQTNITQLGTISNLTVSGRTTTANATIDTLTLGSTQLTASGSDLNNLSGVMAGTASSGKALVVNSSRDISNINNMSAGSVTASSLTGMLQTSSQTNITQVGVLNSLEVGGNSYIRFSNNSSSFQSYEQWSNTISTPVVARMEINNESARLGTFSNHPLRFMSNNSVSMSIDNTGNVNVGSQASTSFRLNVNGSANFTSLNLGGNAVAATASELNNIAGSVAGAASNGKVLIVDNTRSLTNLGSLTASTVSANSLVGTITTSSQPGITEIGNLSSLTIDSSGVGLTLKNITPSSLSSFRIQTDNRNLEIGMRGSASSVLPGCMYMSDSAATRLVMDTVGNFTLGGTVLTNNRLNVIGNLNTTSLSIGNVAINSSPDEINYLFETVVGSATARKALVVDLNRDVVNIRNLTASTISGVLSTPVQTNITQVGTLNSLNMSGDLTGLSNLSMTGNLTGASTVSANVLTGTLSTPVQTNITQVGVLSSVTTSGNLKVGTTSSPATDMVHMEGNSSNGIGIQIENRNTTSNSTSYVRFSGYHNSKDDYDLARISCGYVPVNANYGHGYLAFSTRDNNAAATSSERMRITEIGRVGIGKVSPGYELDVAGTVNCDSLRVGSQTVPGTDLTKINGITNGSASASRALVVDSSRNIANINVLTASRVATDGGVDVGTTVISNSYMYSRSDMYSDGVVYANGLQIPRSGSSVTGTVIRGMYSLSFNIGTSTGPLVTTVAHNLNLSNPSSSNIFFTAYGGDGNVDQFAFRVLQRSNNSFNVRITRIDGGGAGWGIGWNIGYMIMAV